MVFSCSLRLSAEVDPSYDGRRPASSLKYLCLTELNQLRDDVTSLDSNLYNTIAFERYEAIQK